MCGPTGFGWFSNLQLWLVEHFCTNFEGLCYLRRVVKELLQSCQHHIFMLDSICGICSLLQNKCSLHKLASGGLTQKKCSSGMPSSSQRQDTDISSMVAMSVHLSAMMLKQEAWWRCFSRDSSTHVPSSSMNSATATCVATQHSELFSPKVV